MTTKSAILLTLLFLAHFLTPTGDIQAEAIIRTVAGNGEAQNNGDEGHALKVAIGQTFGVEIGPDGALYVTEVQNHRVRRIDLKTQQITTVAGNGSKGYAGDGGAATAASMNEPYEVRFDGEGNMFVVEMMNHIVRRVDAKKGKIQTIAGTGERGYGGDGGPATDAQLNRPHSIALDGRGNLYIADIGNHRIRRVDLETGKIESIAGTAEKRLPESGQIATGNPILGPRALCVHQGDLWIALREGHSVWKMPLDTGRLEHVAGSGQKGYDEGGDDAKQAKFNGPKGIACDAQGRVYVVDTENQVIRRIDPKSNQVTTIAGAGPEARGFRGDGEVATKAWMDRPHGICLDVNGNVYIGDTNNHRVRQVARQ